jgi:hypothetical protein
MIHLNGRGRRNIRPATISTDASRLGRGAAANRHDYGQGQRAKNAIIHHSGFALPSVENRQCGQSFAFRNFGCNPAVCGIVNELNLQSKSVQCLHDAQAFFAVEPFQSKFRA